MIISHKHKFIYMKAYKVAGTSTEILLETFCGKNDIITPIDPGDSTTHKSRNKGCFHQHMGAQKIRKNIGRKIFHKYFKFISVRNPWDRVVSAYFWLPQKNRSRYSFKHWVQNTRQWWGAGGVDFWSKIEGIFILDDFIRYENLEEDTKRILKKLNIEYNDFSYPQAKIKIRPSNKHYTEYYDDKTRKIIAKKFKKDIEFFGYKFERL